MEWELFGCRYYKPYEITNLTKKFSSKNPGDLVEVFLNGSKLCWMASAAIAPNLHSLPSFCHCASDLLADKANFYCPNFGVPNFLH
jgi:hypothetical protein